MSKLSGHPVRKVVVDEERSRSISEVRFEAVRPRDKLEKAKYCNLQQFGTVQNHKDLKNCEKLRSDTLCKTVRIYKIVKNYDPTCHAKL